jgi:D-alanyl-D-alanine carboxypeptidase
VSRYKSDDVELLLPAFRVAVKLLVQKMVAWGFRPIVFDTLRTADESAFNARRGTGKANSIHQFGCAADLICDEHGWSCADHGCDYFDVLGREAKSLKLVWGGDWPRRDMPHTQGISVAMQPAMRALGTWPVSAAARNQLVIDFLSRRA